MSEIRYNRAPAPCFAVQKRRAVCAVTAAKTIMMLVGEGFAAKNQRMRALIEGVRESCRGIVKEGKIPLSLSAEQELHLQLSALGRYTEAALVKTGEEAAHYWSALVVAISALVVDATATARSITRRKCWRKLQANMDTLADILTETFPGCDLLGTEMYMEISR